MAHGDAREGNWRGNWRMQWVASTLHTTSEHGVSSITTADAHTSAASSRLNWRPAAYLNGLFRSSVRRNVVSARVPSHFKWHLPYHGVATYTSACVVPLRLCCNSFVDVFTSRAMNLLIIKLGIPRLAEQLSTEYTLPPWEHQISLLPTVQRDAASSCRTRASWT